MVVINEAFWVSVSFVVFCGFAYFPFKKFFIGAVNKKIAEIEAFIIQSEQLKIQSQARLAQLSSEYEMLVKSYEASIAKAKASAEKIKQDTIVKLEAEILHIQSLASSKTVNAKNAILSSFYLSIIDEVFVIVRSFMSKNEDYIAYDDEYIEKVVKQVIAPSSLQASSFN
jgi:F0F1-type ATP synthase membrane subunit b/b'